MIIMTQKKRQATREPPITHERLCRINGERGEKENDKLKLAVVKEGPNPYQQTEERLSPGPEILNPQDRQSTRYCLPEMWYG